MTRSPASESAASATTASLSPGDIVEIDCTDLIAKTGQAVGRADGMVVYALGPVPGERARVRIEAVKPRYAVGELVELLTRSPERSEPFCPAFGLCGGCQVQHLAYPAQLRWKRGLVENALRRLGGIRDAEVAPAIGMDDPRAYRNKMALVVDRSGPAPAFGFYAARSHETVPLTACPVIAPQLERVLKGLWEASADPATLPAFDDARHVVARTARESGQTVVALSTERASRTLGAVAPALAAHLPGVVGIANSFEPASENAVLGRRHAAAFGTQEIEETIDGIKLRVSAGSFFQVNAEIVGKIFAFLTPLTEGVERVVDLYCGAGTFALFFAAQGAAVVGIEENGGAVREARASAALNGLGEQTAFYAGRTEAILRSERGKELLASADAVFLDPPRKGCDAGVLAALSVAAVRRIWYLSCNPATLARDAAQLIAGGYRLERVQPFDMFPHTGHVEALAVLSR